jgi:hypothetical protein
MPYCNIDQITKVLAQTLTTSSALAPMNGQPVDLISIGTTIDSNLIKEEDALYYIQLADAHINSALSQQYVTPIKEICELEIKLKANLDEYTDELLSSNAYMLSVGDNILITDGVNSDRISVLSINGEEIIYDGIIENLYTVDNTRIMKVSYPNPLPFISARLAAAALYEKYTKAQQEPAKSEYSDLLKSQAENELNNIREGRTILFGAIRRGWRFANPNLVDRYGVRSPFDSDGTRSSNSQ